MKHYIEIEKAGRAGLIPTRVQVTRGRQTFETTVYRKEPKEKSNIPISGKWIGTGLSKLDRIKAQYKYKLSKKRKVDRSSIKVGEDATLAADYLTVGGNIIRFGSKVKVKGLHPSGYFVEHNKEVFVVSAHKLRQ